MIRSMSGSDGDINYANIDRHLHPQVRAAVDAGYADQPEGETVTCACGYSGPPEVILRLSEWDVSDSDWDLMVCPKCGDA